ncbi:phage tail protein [Paracoccus denitrificans]|uniref:phage tail protein n=1 Tax=Paracoccus denitrificans TaxID=266 RepID=UPI001E4DFF7A|nr:phage tail protein [Paracoccus denitrificans]UFS64403.1 phage tail protein [Paracoccus denitrificans]
MRKLLMITTALVGFATAEPAAAAPVGTWVATAIFGAGAAGTFAYAVVAGVVSMAASIGLSMIANKLLTKKPRQDEVRAELTRPTSLPAYRFVYGKTWAPGTPVGWTVKGRVLYICYLLNSRPSAGPFKVLFDKREVEKTGDEFDFAAGGATATNTPFNGHVRYWIGRGDQTACPAQIVSETSGYFTASDAWRGRTVLWARLECGADDERQERWPATPPELNVDGNWSLVEDPRDGQTKFSRNQGLIVLDALRNNPVRPYADTYLRLDTFSWAADVAQQAVGVKGGGTIPRYRCDGILTFTDGTEIEDQLRPLLDAGASRLTRIGGRLAIVPAVQRASVKTITDVTDGQPLNLVRWKSSDDLHTEVVARFPAPDRAYESAETPAYVIPGAQAADGGVSKRLTVDLDFVTDHRQAQRVAKIMGWRSRMQRQVSGELFPDCFDLVSGSVCQVDLGYPYSAWQGKYEVESIAPAAGLNDDDSITIRLPAVLTETSDEITAWDAEAEEQDMLPGAFSAAGARVLPPPKPVLTTGTAATQVSGGVVAAGVLAAWTASVSPSALGYEWEWRLYLSSSWRAGGYLDQSAEDENGVYSGLISLAAPLTLYQVRVRTVGMYGRSSWVLSDPIAALGPSVSLNQPPQPSAAAVNASRINITGQQANDLNAHELLFYANDIDSPLTASALDSRNAGASVTVTVSETGLSTGTTRFYWTRARDQWGNLSDFSASATATTP